MPTKTEMANMAISHLTSGKTISDLDTDISEEGVACRTFYEAVLRMALRDFDWPWARKLIELELITEHGVDDEHVNDEFHYAYRYPPSVVAVRKIKSGIRNDTRQSRVTWEEARDDEGRLILTDYENAEIRATVLNTLIEDPQYWPPDFVIAFTYLWAFFIAPRVAGQDPTGKGKDSYNLYQSFIGKAKANAANEEQGDEDPEAEMIRARGI